jgi:hypothetical protein
MGPPVVIGLQPESVIDPGAYALGVASGYSLLARAQADRRDRKPARHLWSAHLRGSARTRSRSALLRRSASDPAAHS